MGAKSSYDAIQKMQENISDLTAMVGRLEAVVEQVAEHSEDSRNALRGEGQETGLVGAVRNLEILTVEIKAVQLKQSDTTKELQTKLLALEKTVADYPSFTWLLRYRTKATIGWIIFMVSISIIFLSPLVDPNLAAALLHFAQVPAPIIHQLTGR